MFETMTFQKRLMYGCLLLVLLLSSCVSGKDAIPLTGKKLASGNTAVAAESATKEIPATATLAPTDPPTPTLTATATATPKPTATKTPKPTPTATPNRTATAQAAKDALAEATLRRIEPDLTKYGYTLADGHLLWFYEEPLDIEVREYNMSLYNTLDAPLSDNFIIHSNITWETTGGLAGCGLYFRLDPEAAETHGNEFVLMRLQNAPAWAISYYEYGTFQRSLSSWVFAASIKDRNQDTNDVTLVVDGRNITPYINGKKQRLVEDITLKDGLFAITASQESGVSTCVFEDTWIWEIDKK